MNVKPKTQQQAAVFLTIGEAAEFLRVKPYTVYNLCATPDFPAVKVGRKWTFRQDLLEKWWEEKLTEKPFEYL